MTRAQAVILYGPPAVGKDTIDAALRDLSPHYRHFERVKVGPGRTEGYRMADDAALQELRDRRAILWENSRYEATYVVDRPGLIDAMRGGVPIVHLGQPEAVTALADALPDVRWTVVALTCPEGVAAERIRRRGDHDVAARMTAWHQTPSLVTADVRVDTGSTRPDQAARLIDAAVFGTIYPKLGT